jgi:threonine dehydrogenase-like Zn-dependent dehydrogenase
MSSIDDSSGHCFFCTHGFSARCANGELFGSTQLDGSQAEYFRVPMADTTLSLAPTELGEELILMADIFPTGYITLLQNMGHLLT